MRPREARRRPVTLGRVQQRRHKPDYWLLLLSVILLVFGLIVVYAISPGLSVQKHVGENYYVGKQLLAIALGVGVFAVVSNMPIQWWRRMEIPLLTIAAISAIAVRFFGERVNGAYRWIQVGGLSFQAAELIKFALLIWLAGFLTDRMRNNEVADTNKTLKPLLIALAIVALVVGKIQSDLGSTAVIVAIMGSMVYLAGFPIKRIMSIGAVILVAVTLLILGSSYRRERLSTFINPSKDCLGAGYQACEALITVGSGGMFGLGLGRSVQAYGYLPEAANDSIFAIFAEKFGFVGCVLLLGLFMGFFSRLKRILERAPDTYSQLLVTGILAWLSTQALINIGAMVGLLPLKGITLPFISYGGTSIVFVMAAIGIVFQVSRYTTYSVSSSTQRTGESYDNSPYRRGIRGAYHPNPSGRG
jgi:cell division protein FtsW